MNKQEIERKAVKRYKEELMCKIASVVSFIVLEAVFVGGVIYNLI